MYPCRGTFAWMRQRKSWASSSGVGTLKDVTKHALRVDAAEDVLDGAVLAAGVHRLEDDEQRLGGLRVQPLLEVGELAGQLRQLRGRFLLVAGRAVGGPRVAVGEGEVLAGADEPPFAVARAHFATQASPWRSRCRYSEP